MKSLSEFKEDEVKMHHEVKKLTDEYTASQEEHFVAYCR